MTARFRSLCRTFQTVIPPARPGLTVLAYHLVGAGTKSPVDLPESVFEAQMRELRDSRRAVALGAALGVFERGEPFAEDRVAVTFDDAFENFDRVARPILERFSIPATLFVPTDFVDGRAPGPLAGAESLPPIGWGRLRDLTQSDLVEIGSHSRSHPDLRTLDDEDLEREVAGSAAVIRERIGFEPAVFCYPRGQVSRRVERCVAKFYHAAVAGGGVKNRPGRVRMTRLNRVSLRADMPTSLAPLVGSSVVLEEWLANRVRLLRRPSRS